MKRFLRPMSVFAIFALFLTTGQGCLGGGGGEQVVQREDVTLDVWGVFDNKDVWDDLIDSYRAAHGNVTINYRELRFSEYETELIRALAEGRGPDVFMVHNTKMKEFQDLMVPMPASLNITETRVTGTVQRKATTIAVEKPTMSARQLRQTFVEQVPSDVILSYQSEPGATVEDRTYGFPLSVDSLALFYNRDLLDAAGIAQPPATWNEFNTAVSALTSYDATGEIAQSGAALGTANNVERSVDILTLLMLQNGTQMTDDRGRVTFNSIPSGTPEGVFPGLDAATFYTDFANPTKEVYTWNDSLPNSFEAFANGRTAFFLGYSYHLPLLRTAAPKLNFAVAPVPQIAGGRQVNFANYWVNVVAASSEHQDWAWDFLHHTVQDDQVASYLNAARKPTAHRSFVGPQSADEELGVFAEQALTARSWYHGDDTDAMETALRELISSVRQGVTDPVDALNLAAKKVAQTFK